MSGCSPLYCRSFLCRVEEAVPQLVDFVQSALNITAHNDQSEIEVLLAMVNQKISVEKPDWNAIASAAEHQQGPCTRYVKVLAGVARILPAECILDASNFWKAFGTEEQSSQRFLGSEFLSKLASLKFGKTDHFPWLQTASLKANLLSADAKLVDGFCKLVTPTHLASLTANANRKVVNDMENLLTLGRKILKQLDVDTAVATKLIGRLDTRVVLHFSSSPNSRM